MSGSSKSYMKEYRDKNREKLREQRREWTKLHGGRNRKRWNEFFVSLGLDRCCRCGYYRFAGALEFHHTNPDNKNFSVANETRRPFTPENVIDIMEEVEKCVVLCANCHRELHYMEEK